MKFSKFILSILFFTIPAVLNAQPYQQLLDNPTKDLLHEALSGETAKEYVIDISRWHRIQGSREYRMAGEYVLEKLRNAGFSENEAYVESFKSDGKIVYQTWQSPSGWDIESAELRMIEPYDERICGFPEIAMSLITYSNPGDETGELVYVGSGTSESDYEGKDVRGKAVLATGYGGSVHRLAVLKYGAKFVVCYLDDERAMEYPDMLAYTGMWPRTNELEDTKFGFNLTRRQGEKLRKLIETGAKVVVKGTVQGIGLEPYFMDVPVAVIPGSEKPDEILVFCGHLDHPKESANDNASGSAAMLDMAITMKKLINEGRIERPKRTLHFLWVPEFYGMMAYCDAHPEMKGPAYGGKYLANINLDMVGENLELLHTRAGYTRTPMSIPSVLNDVVENMAEMVSKMDIRTPRGSLSVFNYSINPYSGGSDHNIFIDRKIPAMMSGHGDYTHHTSEDTPDKVDPVEIERAEMICLSSLYYLANLDDDQAVDLTYLAAGNAAKHLGQSARRAKELLKTADFQYNNIAWIEAQNILDHELEWAKEAVRSIIHFNKGAGTAELIDMLCGQLNIQHEVLSKSIKQRAYSLGMKKGYLMEPNANANTDERIPIRLTRGPIDGSFMNENLKAADLEWLNANRSALRGNRQFELHNFIDGKKTVTEIRNALSAEYGPVVHDVVRNYIELLVNNGLARWK